MIIYSRAGYASWGLSLSSVFLLLPSEPTPPLDFEPRNPRYATQEEREKSFDKWPRHMIQSKSQLVEAGFYYTGMHSVV